MITNSGLIISMAIFSVGISTAAFLGSSARVNEGCVKQVKISMSGSPKDEIANTVVMFCYGKN